MTDPIDDASSAFDAEPNGNQVPPSLMWTMAKIADRDGVSRQAVQKAIKRFANDGLITGIERDQKGYITAVNVVEYDRARGTATDPAKLQGSATRKITDEDASPHQPTAKTPSDYTRAITENALYETELKKIKLRELQGQLVPLEELETAIQKCAEAIIAAIERLKFKYEELAAAVANNGIVGSRAVLKQYVFDLRTAVSDALCSLLERETRQPTSASSDQGGDLQIETGGVDR
jgi:DNA-binding Lrp family transcriptional regulator